MKLVVRILLILVMLSGTGALLLGIAFWTGHAWSLIQVHMLLGLTLVAALCVLAAIAWRATSRPGLPLFVILFALGVAALGLEQNRLLPGSAHWVVQLLHLATAGFAIGLGRKLAVASRAR